MRPISANLTMACMSTKTACRWSQSPAPKPICPPNQPNRRRRRQHRPDWIRNGSTAFWAVKRPALHRVLVPNASHLPRRFPLNRGFILYLGEPVSTSPLLTSEEHTSELHFLMRISYAVFCLT